MKKILFISSTGGHLSELMKLYPLFKNYDYSIITEKDATNVFLKEKYPKRVFFLPYCTRSKIIRYVFIYLFVILKSVILFLKLNPQVVVSTGTHTAIPMIFIAKIFGKKIIYIETYANITRKTLTGKIVYPFADLFIVYWNKMKKLYPKAICIENVTIHNL